jgi:hypothetical protein
MELVTLKYRLQNLGALDKEAPDIGGFFLIHNFSVRAKEHFPS